MFTGNLRGCMVAAGLVAFASGLQPAPAAAQSALDVTITQFSDRSIRGYMQPLADALVANLSTGYFFTSAVRKGRFGIALEAVGMSTVIDDAMRVYTDSTPPGFTPATFETPTVFGGTAPTIPHSSINGISYRGSDGVIDKNTDYFPGAIPQLRLSGILGTELVLRYFTSSLIGSAWPEDDLPELKFFGFGLRHSLSQYMADFPVDITVNGGYSSATMGDLVDVRATTFGATVGKTLSMLSLYGGVSSDGGTMSLNYTSDNPQSPGSIDVDLDAERDLRFVLGSHLNLSFLQLFGSAAFGNVTTYSAGLRLFGY